MIAKQRGEGAHLLDALWLRSLGDVTGLRRLRFQCRNTGQMIAEHRNRCDRGQPSPQAPNILTD
jgi:hypothetical protein